MVPKLFLKPTIQIVFIHSFSTYSYNKFSNLRIRTSLAIQNYFAIYFRRHKTTCQTHLKVSRLLAKKIFLNFELNFAFFKFQSLSDSPFNKFYLWSIWSSFLSFLFKASFEGKESWFVHRGWTATGLQRKLKANYKLKYRASFK